MNVFEYLLGENIKNLIFDEENDRVLYPDSLIKVRLFENNISSYMQMDDYGKDEFWYLDRKEYDRLCKYNIIVPDRESGGADTINPNEFTIIIPDSVTEICKGAFLKCSSLESITLPFIGSGSYYKHFGYIFGAYNYNDNYMYFLIIQRSSDKSIIIV